MTRVTLSHPTVASKSPRNMKSYLACQQGSDGLGFCEASKPLIQDAIPNCAIPNSCSRDSSMKYKPLTFALLSLLLLPIASLLAADPAEPPKPVLRSIRTIEGWTVRVDDRL